MNFAPSGPIAFLMEAGDAPLLRANALAPHLSSALHVLTFDDRPDLTTRFEAASVRRLSGDKLGRGAELLDALSAVRPSLVVADCSPDLAMLVRLAGLRLALVVRGPVSGSPALLASRMADLIISVGPMSVGPEDLDPTATAPILHLGVIPELAPTEIPTRKEAREWLEIGSDKEVVTVLDHVGPAGFPPSRMIELARRHPAVFWLRLGEIDAMPDSLPPNLRLDTNVESPILHLSGADLIVAGSGSLMHVGQFRRPVIFAGDNPPDAETDALQALGLIHMKSGCDEGWSEALEAARAIDLTPWDVVFQSRVASVARSLESLRRKSTVADD